MVHFFRGIGIAASGYARSASLIAQCKLRWVYLVPVVLLVLNVLVGVNMATYLGDLFVEWLRALIPLSLGSSWWADALRAASSVVAWIAFFLISLYVGGFLLLVLLSPLLAYISERVDEHLTGNHYPFRLGEFVGDVFRGIAIAFRNLIIELALTLVLLVVGLVPGVGIVAATLLMAISAYYYGFSFMDYTLERHRYTVRQSVAFVKHNRGAAVGVGAVYLAIIAIPFVGLALGSLAAVLATVAGTAASCRIIESSQE